MIEQERHGVVYFRSGDDVVVVEHQDDVLRSGLEIVDQRGDDGLERCLVSLEEGSRVLAQVVRRCCERCKDVGPELLRVVVSRVEGQPGGGALTGKPVGHQGGLAEASGRRHQGQCRVLVPCGAVA